MSDCKACAFEVPESILMNLKGSVSYQFLEKGGIDPTNIITSEQESLVRVDITFGGKLSHLFSLTWCVCVAFESHGSGPEGELCVKDIPWNPCRDGDVTTVDVVVPAGYLPAKECGAVYNITVTVTAKDQCGHPAPIAALCRGEYVMVYETHPA